jgi:hypothetical protein
MESKPTPPTPQPSVADVIHHPVHHRVAIASITLVLHRVCGCSGRLLYGPLAGYSRRGDNNYANPRRLGHKVALHRGRETGDSFKI